MSAPLPSLGNLKNPKLLEKCVRRKSQGGMGFPPVLTLISVSIG